MDQATPQNKTCRNCNASIPEVSKYCLQCGQKYTTGKVSIWSFLQEFFTEHLNLDSKLAITALALFVPGKLTTEFFKGKHRSYASPLRLFLISGVILFSVVGLSVFDVETSKNPSEEILTRFRKKVFVQQLDTIIHEHKNQFNHPQVNAALDSLSDKMIGIAGTNDSINLADFDISIIDFSSKKGHKVAVKDIVELSTAELVEKYSDGFNFFQKLLLTQTAKAFKRGNSLAEFIFSKLSLGILFMMPFLALFLKLLYIRRKRYYVEHLVFSFHYHAFLFIICILLTLIAKYLPDFLTVSIILFTFAYLFLALKRVYGQGKRKTLIKFIILNTVYLVLVSFFALLTIILSFLLF